MFSFPLFYLLIPFGLVFLLALLFFFFNIFHIKRYAIQSKATSLLMLIYFVSFGVLTALIGSYLLTVDWTEEFEPSELLPSFESSSRLE
ncbi:MAG: hypothetical protein AAB776_03335 [Patescibacteria group bacterium]